MEGGKIKYAGRAPLKASLSGAASLTFAVNASAPLRTKRCSRVASRPTTRTFSPLISRESEITEPVLPVARKITYITFPQRAAPTPGSWPWVFSRRPSPRTLSPPHSPHPRAAPRPFPDRSSAPVRCAPPSLWYHPPRLLARRAANTLCLRLRHCESKPKKRRSPYSPAHSAVANPLWHRSRPASIPSHDRPNPLSPNPRHPPPSPPSPSF